MTAITNAQIADFLRRYSSVLALEGADRFKIKAYRRAAETLESLTQDVGKLVSHGEDLKQFPGIGKGISTVIEQIVATGKLPQLEQASRTLDPSLLELATKPQLDPQKVKRVYKKLDISSLQELQERLDSGEIREKLGARLEFHVRQGLDERPRMLLWAAEKLVPAIEAFLHNQCKATRVAQAGSLRRKQDTIGDLSFFVSGKSASAIFGTFKQFGAVRSSELLSKNQAEFVLSGGRRVTLTFAPVTRWGLEWLFPHRSGIVRSSVDSFPTGTHAKQRLFS